MRSEGVHRRHGRCLVNGHLDGGGGGSRSGVLGWL